MFCSCREIIYSCLYRSARAAPQLSYLSLSLFFSLAIFPYLSVFLSFHAHFSYVIRASRRDRRFPILPRIVYHYRLVAPSYRRTQLQKNMSFFLGAFSSVSECFSRCRLSITRKSGYSNAPFVFILRCRETL